MMENSKKASTNSMNAQALNEQQRSLSIYEDQKERARNPNPKVRMDLACDPTTLPEILYFLAEDSVDEVRRHVALNENSPRQADLLLTRDKDGTIRQELAAKIARLTPELPEDRRTTLYKLTVQALEILAEDQVVRIREILSQALKNVASAPPHVIMTLARDPILTVSSPILEFSPVLSDSDLLEIIQSNPIQGALKAICRRKSLEESLSEAIVKAGDEATIAELLSNKSAQIREDTLDFIIDRASDQMPWHEPLAMRPKLSPRAVQRIASFVAMNLLDRMQKRLDLNDEVMVAMAEAVEQRLAKDTHKKLEQPEWANTDNLDETIAKMYKSGTLTGSALEEALAKGEKRFVILGLSVLSGISSDTVNNIIANRNAKAVIALTWKAGLKPHFASQLQSQLVGLSPKDMVRISDGRWPMSPGDMQWHLDFYKA
ncbi:MAG: DUF2336 domain-containing protein [Alphaproteobacteria bacterium]|nr:DUF2336 domain-containing protein [Alphaproteobacteria bacterium]